MHTLCCDTCMIKIQIVTHTFQWLAVLNTQSPTRCPKSSWVWVCKVLIHLSPDTCNSCHLTLSGSDLCLLSAPHFLVPGNLVVSLYSGWTCNVCLCPLTPCIYTDPPGTLQSIFQLIILVYQLCSLGCFLGLYKVCFSWHFLFFSSEIAESDWARRTLHSAAAHGSRVFLSCFQNSKEIIIARINVSIAAKYAVMDYDLTAHATQLTMMNRATQVTKRSNCKFSWQCSMTRAKCLEGLSL